MCGFNVFLRRKNEFDSRMVKRYIFGCQKHILTKTIASILSL